MITSPVPPLILVLLMTGACQLIMLDKRDPNENDAMGCGDGELQLLEECDGVDLNGNSCSKMGFYGGSLSCDEDCRFDLSSCELAGRCGDGVLQILIGEVCDGDELRGRTCQTQGFLGGTLACNDSCTGFVTSGCHRCGDEVLDPYEVCDGAELNGHTCATRGFLGGTLACGENCNEFDTSGCHRCGDGVLDSGEVCDGTALDGQTCQTQGFLEGTLACNDSCTGFVTTECTSCGNSQVDEHEICDGPVLNGHTCAMHGFVSGTLSCNADCISFDTSLCTFCGNGIINSSEVCDGPALNGQTCAAQGYVGGSLACNSFCTAFNTTACHLCGNGSIDAPEICDGTDLDHETCVTLGYYGGTLGCQSNCGAFNVSSCSVQGRCGDGVIQPLYGEECDGANLGGATCADFDPSRPAGLLRCDPYCRASTAICRSADIELVLVPAGTFQRDTMPANTSTVSSFKISVTEITRSQWVAVTGWADPSDTLTSSGVYDPVQMVNWYHAIAFCNKLSLREGMTPVYSVSGVDFAALAFGDIPVIDDIAWNAVAANWAADGYRLPTEMEWMWAAMGADTANPGATNTTGYVKAFAGSTGSNSIGDYVWYISNSSNKTHPAGIKLPNELGLYDMSGNVFEWTWDWHTFLPSGAQVDYRGPSSGSHRVYHGGNWNGTASNCTVAYRSGNGPGSRNVITGFRVVRP